MGPRLAWLELAHCMSIALGLLRCVCTMLIIVGIQMAVYWVNDLPSKIIDYLLVDAWDIDNSDKVQVAFWCNIFDLGFSYFDILGSGGLDLIFQLSRRICALGQGIQADLIHDIVRSNAISSVKLMKETNYHGLCKFLINQGADIEYRDSFRMETALLVAAEVDSHISSGMMPDILWLDADYSAVDYKGRGPLHLALKPSRKYYLSLLRHQSLKKKLVHLLQAGCSIHATDHYGRSPTDVARRYKRTKAWEAALQAVGKLECGKSECQCEIIVRLAQAFRLSEKRFTLVTKDCSRHATNLYRR